MVQAGAIGRVFRALMRWSIYLAVAGAVIFLLLLALWRFVPPISTLMLGRIASFETMDRQWVPLSRISPHLAASVIASEDGQFCRHRGVDWGAMREVLDDAGSFGPARGASTLAMQTAKNLFLWPSRSIVRKGLEIPMALAVDFAWGKPRVLEVYLNIAEWGDGLFGAQAAARRYFNKDAKDLTASEAALLAAALPNPKARNPARPTARQRNLAAIVVRRAVKVRPYLDCLS
jgi:monofunctional biosynthetic peptidoglycan transglycosylase